MKNKIFLLLLLMVSLSYSKPKLSLVTNGRSSYSIIIASSASRYDSLAASELQRYIYEVSGARLTVESDLSAVQDKEIVIGENSRSKGRNLSQLKEDGGYSIFTKGSKIYFIGKGEKGSLNAVYTFLEKYLGCRMYSANVKVIPKTGTIKLPDINITENPVFTFRSINSCELENPEYRLWHKDLRQNEKDPIWGMFVHTLPALLPADKYFKDHPEYFAMRNGLRVKEQLCLSNPEVFKIVLEELKRLMKLKPDSKIWSVSQNDNFSCCQCPECSRLDEREGSPSGSVLNFTNKVAREFPDKIISTLAYQYSRKAPRTIKPEKNVNIMLCTIECYRTKPLEADTSETSFVHDMKDWCRLTNNIFLWDYVVQFTNYISPFPNLHVLQPNLQLFAKYGAKMEFQQGQGRSPGCEFSELRTYLIAKLLWDPYLNVDSLMNDFLGGYYGNAGKYVRNYIDLMRESLIKSGAGLWIYDNPVNSMKDYLAPGLMRKYNKIFDDAERAVRNSPEFLERVRASRLPLVYAMLEQAKVLGVKEYGTMVAKNGKFEVNPKIKNLLKQFGGGYREMPTACVNEKGLRVSTYIERYNTMLAKCMKNPLALNKPVKFSSPPSSKYPANGDCTLTDGLRGDEDHHFNWAGFEGEDMEAVVDFGKSVSVKKVSADFLQIQLSWIFLPVQAEVSVSEDGNSFTEVSVIRHDEPLEKEDTFIHNFCAEFGPVNARYIKVKAKNIKTCPRWHPGYPDKAWIFTDEIVVE